MILNISLLTIIGVLNIVLDSSFCLYSTGDDHYELFATILAI